MTFAEYLSKVVSSRTHLEARVSVATSNATTNGTCIANGTVTEYLPRKMSWRVLFEDGEQIDLNLKEVDAALDLYRRKGSIVDAYWRETEGEDAVTCIDLTQDDSDCLAKSADECKPKEKRVKTKPDKCKSSEQVYYTDEFFKYAALCGESAARQYYGAWSPPEGTPNPYGNASPEAAAAAVAAARQHYGASSASLKKRDLPTGVKK